MTKKSWVPSPLPETGSIYSTAISAENLLGILVLFYFIFLYYYVHWHCHWRGRATKPRKPLVFFPSRSARGLADVSASALVVVPLIGGEYLSDVGVTGWIARKGGQGALPVKQDWVPVRVRYIWSNQVWPSLSSIPSPEHGRARLKQTCLGSGV